MKRRLFLALAAITFAAGCAAPKAPPQPLEDVTAIVVQKERRLMHLMNDKEILKTYKVGLGFAPVGHKRIQGDGRTPEGLYYIDRKNKQSKFHLSLGVSYPNEKDTLRAASYGASPGGDIFIHGKGPRQRNARGDWTWGCIAVEDHEIEEIFAAVPYRTPILITP
jgi:murein L,D-transpeptidase YafK